MVLVPSVFSLVGRTGNILRVLPLYRCERRSERRICSVRVKEIVSISPIFHFKPTANTQAETFRFFPENSHLKLRSKISRQKKH